MREVTIEKLREELGRFPALLTQTKVLHPCGMRLHGSSDVLSPPHAKAMAEAGVRHVYFLEPGESEGACARTLAIEMAEPGEVRAGDIVMQELKGPDGTLLIPAATKMDEAWLGRLGGHAGFVPIRKRTLDAEAVKARQYLALAPPQPPKPPRVDTRVTQLTVKRDVTVKPLLVARARIYVLVEDEMARSLICGYLKSDGHEALEFATLSALLNGLIHRPDVVIVDLANARAACDAVRQAALTRGAGLLVAAGEGQAREVYKALQAGANGSLPLPPRKDTLMEAVQGVQRALGRAVRMKAAVRGERRRSGRESVQFACRLVDKFINKPLAIETATVEDIHERGLRLVYTRPTWPAPWAYLAGSVHPKHFFFNYAKVNPLGREISLAFVSPAGAAMQVMASFVYIHMDGVFETAGLALQGLSDVKRHMTTMRISRF